VIEAAGSTFVDASIIGAPPRKPGTRFYASGPEVARFETLRAHGLDVRPLSDRIGDASAIKMCYAAMTKGLSALASELLIASHRLGVQDALQAELESSQKGLVGWVGNSLRSTPSKAHRWVGEMEEIAATFAAVGLTPKILDGAADMFRYIATTDLGHEAPEEVDMTRDLWTIAAELSREPAGLRG
jgi:3-hydroxyisobutyrate dehydrogenase-like beta-hydroxyacid dehydrogenase